MLHGVPHMRFPAQDASFMEVKIASTYFYFIASDPYKSPESTGCYCINFIDWETEDQRGAIIQPKLPTSKKWCTEQEPGNPTTWSSTLLRIPDCLSYPCFW